MSVSGYDPDIVFAWLDAHCTRRADGRYIRLGKRVIDDSHRDTFERWDAVRQEPGFRVPLGRWSDILFEHGVEWYEFEQWAEEHHGWCGYHDDES